jgi:hypothetical protein
VKKTMIMLLGSALLLTTACSKKNSDDPPVPPSTSIEGYWVGKHKNTIGFDEPISMLFKPGGVLRVYGIGNNLDTTALIGAAKVTGEWTRVGNTVTTSYKVSTSTITTSQVLNDANTQLTGTWALNGTTKGLIELNKQ